MQRIAGAAIMLALCLPIQAQKSQLSCRGAMGDVTAVLTGVRQFTPTNGLGDGYVSFVGNVSAGGIDGRMVYQGSTQSAPFSGIIETSQGVLRIGVLDNTGGRMIIYDGTASLGPPRVIGVFACEWQ